MQLPTDVLRLAASIDVKVIQPTFYDHFSIFKDRVEYRIMLPRGEIIAIADAEVQDIQESDDGHVRRIVLQTATHKFEVVPALDEGNGRYLAYKIPLRGTVSG